MALETEAAVPVDDVPGGAAQMGYVEQTAGAAASAAAAAAAAVVVDVVASAAGLAAVLVAAVLASFVLQMLVAAAVGSLPGDDRPGYARVSGRAVAVG